ncbi:MAG: acyl-CoA dehydrogenase family protein [Desulfobacteria bacterium]
MEKLHMEEIRDTARRIATERLKPRAVETDRARTFPWENMKELGDAGFHRLIVSEQEGGLGLGRNAFASVVAELAKACASTALVYVSSAVVAKAIELGAGDGTRKKWLPEMTGGRSLGAFAVHEPDSGSNAGAIATRAIREDGHYVINGTKFFITSAGEANLYLVLVRTNPENGAQGMSTLLVEKDAPGLSFGRPEDKMGLTSTSSRELFFSDCRVPAGNLVGKDGEGMQIIGKTVVGWGFFGAAAISLGIAKSATELAIEHAKKRMISGQPIGAHQAVQFMIADMILKTDAAESLLSACASNADSAPGTAAINGFKAKLFASEAAVEITNLAIQVLAGHGYTREYVVERLFRDARGLTLHFKTSEWLRQDIAKAALGL